MTFCGARPETTTPRSSGAQSDPLFLDRWDQAWLSGKAGFLSLAREKGASSAVSFHSYPKVGPGKRGLGGCLCALSAQLPLCSFSPNFFSVGMSMWLLTMVLPSANSSFVFKLYKSCQIRILVVHSFIPMVMYPETICNPKNSYEQDSKYEPVSTHLSSEFFARKKKSSAFIKKKLASQGTMVKSLRLWK